MAAARDVAPGRRKGVSETHGAGSEAADWTCGRRPRSHQRKGHLSAQGGRGAGTGAGGRGARPHAARGAPGAGAPGDRRAASAVATTSARLPGGPRPSPPLPALPGPRGQRPHVLPHLTAPAAGGRADRGGSRAPPPPRPPPPPRRAPAGWARPLVPCPRDPSSHPGEGARRAGAAVSSLRARPGPPAFVRAQTPSRAPPAPRPAPPTSPGGPPRPARARPRGTAAVTRTPALSRRALRSQPMKAQINHLKQPMGRALQREEEGFDRESGGRSGPIRSERRWEGGR